MSIDQPFELGQEFVASAQTTMKVENSIWARMSVVEQDSSGQAKYFPVIFKNADFSFENLQDVKIRITGLPPQEKAAYYADLIV